MNLSSDEIVNWLVIIGTLGAWFHFVALKPLKTAIIQLEKQMAAVAQELRESRDERRRADVIMAELKKDIEHTNDRIDTVEMEVSRWIDSEK